MNGFKWFLILIGTACAGLGCYGAYEASAAMNGGYLMVAAPVVALSSAILPYFAEQAWKTGHKFKAIIFALILIPAAATVFYAATERVHLAKAGAEAERAAQRSAVTLAERHLEEAKAAVIRAENDAKLWRTKSAKACDPVTCLARWDNAATAARNRVTQATQAVTAASAKAAEESPIKAPVWLLPLALDLVAFITIWAGLPDVTPQPKPIQAPVRRRKPVKRRQALGRGFSEVHRRAVAELKLIKGGKSDRDIQTV